MPANLKEWMVLIAIICALIGKNNWEEKNFSTLFHNRRRRAYHPVEEPYDTRTGFASAL
jgi:hypothetical protein